MLLHFPLPYRLVTPTFPLRLHTFMKVAFLSLIVCYSKRTRGKKSQYNLLSTFHSPMTCDRNLADPYTWIIYHLRVCSMCTYISMPIYSK